MKIIIINRHMKNVLGGSEIQCDLIARNFLDLGHDVTYIALDSKEVIEDIYPVISINKLRIADIFRIIKENRPDVIYWRYNKKGLLKTVLISKIMNIKFVFALSHVNDITKWVGKPYIKNNNLLRNTKLFLGNFKAKIISRVNFNALYCVDGVISLKKDFLNMMPLNISRKKNIHIYNSMEFLPTVDFQWNKPFVVWVANIKKAKNPDAFIDLARKFEGSEIDFIMVGKIQDSYYDFLVTRTNLPSNLHYLGPKMVHEVDSILDKCLFMVHTCDPEGFGNNFIQSWFAGKATVSLYFDPDNLITTNNIGFLSLKSEKLFEHVNELINNDGLRESMGEKAILVAKELFNPMNNAKKLESYLHSL